MRSAALIASKSGVRNSSHSVTMARSSDHPLRGEWKPSRDLHIEPDWVLIYCVDGEVVRFERTGTHADLFGK